VLPNPTDSVPVGNKTAGTTIAVSGAKGKNRSAENRFSSYFCKG